MTQQEQLFDDITTEHPEYRLPDRAVLRTSPEKPASSGETAARVADLLVQTLSHFGIDANVIGQISGPRVTRYELQLAPGTKVSKVAALKDDLSYALATTEIRILAPIPGSRRWASSCRTLAEPRHARRRFDELPQPPRRSRCGSARTSPGAVWADLPACRTC